MLLVIQCIVCCVVFTLIILPAQYKDPLCMIASYPSAVRKRVSELPEYKDVITEKEKKHMGKKVFGIFFFSGVLAAIAYLSGCRSFSETFFHVFVLFFAVNIYDMIVLDWGVFVTVKNFEFRVQKIWIRSIKTSCFMSKVQL